MADYKVNDAALNIAQSVRDAGQAVTESTVAAYERNVGFVQSTFENGVEVLKSHAESARSLLREQSERAQDKQPVDAQALLNTAIAAQERNMHYAQTTFENSVELWKNHVRGTRSLLDKLAEQGQHQQETFPILPMSRSMPMSISSSRLSLTTSRPSILPNPLPGRV